MKNFSVALILSTCAVCLIWHGAFAHDVINFDDFATSIGANDLPSSSPTWNYDDTYTLDMFISKDADHAGGAMRLWRYSADYNTSHMGFTNWGFLEIDNQEKIKGKALRYSVTGGRNEDCNPCDNGGMEVLKKQDYLDYLADGLNPIGSISVGSPDIYIGNATSSGSPVAMWAAEGHNRLSLYAKFPETMIGADNSHPDDTIHVGPFTTDFGGHYYTIFGLNGGGWAHLQLDRHPQNDNNSGADTVNKPAHDEGFISRIYRLYITARDYQGIGTPIHHTYFDEIKFWTDDYANQNDETINSLGVSFDESTKEFQVSLNDKYRGDGQAKSTYEMRYSLSAPITNENWSQAVPVSIQASVANAARSDGKFRRGDGGWAYTLLWARFKLQSSADEDLFANNRIIYFALKDISQNPENHMQINPNLDGTLANQGRNYSDGSEIWDYAHDDPVLDYVKRIDYVLPGYGETADVEAPNSPSGLSVS